MTTPDGQPSRLILLGHPVSHSLSPRMQRAALHAAGISLTYEAVNVGPEALAGQLAALVAAGAAGNVTIPHKRAVAAACAHQTDVARRVGAVNTFWVQDGALWGDNTDVAGFDDAVTTLGTQREGAQVAVLGAGGAAAAVLAAVEQWPDATVAVWSRRPAAVDALVDRCAIARRAPTAHACVTGATLVVNATPIGMTSDALPCRPEGLPPAAHVMDLVYRPGETAWVRAVRSRGHRALDGREMLLHQGARAFARWFGRAPDLTVMRATLSDPG